MTRRLVALTMTGASLIMCPAVDHSDAATPLLSTQVDPMSMAETAQVFSKMQNLAHASETMVEVWMHPETGRTLKKKWRRYRHLSYFFAENDEIVLSFSVKYVFKVWSEQVGGNWQEIVPFTVLDGTDEIGLQWNERLKSYVGMSPETRFLVNGEDRDEAFARRQPLLVMAVTLDHGALRWRYRDLFPSPVSTVTPGGVRVYEEVWTLVNDELDVRWRFKTMDYDAVRVEPTVDKIPWSPERHDTRGLWSSLKDFEAGLGSP